MHKNKPGCSDPRRCQQTVRTMLAAINYYFTVVVFLVASWSIFIAFFLLHFNEAKFLENRWTNPVGDLLIFGIGGLFITVALIVYAQEVVRIARKLEREGVIVQGVIIDRWVEESGEAYVYCIGYRFSYMESMWVGKNVVESSPYNKLEIGDSVEILFLPRNPSISRIQ